VIDLRTLGALDLRDGTGAELRSLLVQPSRTALLVYLGVAAPRGYHRRDSLLALFWPEQDAPSARVALRQALHQLRRAIGDGVLLSRGDEEVALDAARCRCDVAAFEQALDAGAPDRAVDLYRGPFLDGFFLSGAPEFERWVESERDRLGRRYAAALEHLAREAESRGDLAAAVQWWTRLAAHAPHTARVAIHLMNALEAAGDRAGAIRHADLHAVRLRADLDAEPDPDVAALAAQLRSQPSRRERSRPASVAPAGPPAGPAAGPPAGAAGVVPVVGRQRTARLPALLVGLALVGIAGQWAIGTSHARAPHRIAVLPLANQTGDSTEQYLVDGVHEAVITGLAQLGSLSVISRSSVMAYARTAKSAPEIARELGVDALVEGAVFRAGDSVRVTLQLIDSRRDRHLWSGTFEGDLPHMWGLSRDAAQGIATGARITLTGAELARLSGERGGTHEADALYYQARWQFNRNTSDGLDSSIALYRQAIALDSGFAAAYAGLADAYVILGHAYGASPEMFLRARTLARRALELDDGSADAHMVLGHIAFEYDWDWPEAERHFRRAIELNPSSARAHHLYGGGFLVAMSRFEEADREMQLASGLDPLSPGIAAAAAFPALHAGRYADAEGMLRRAVRASTSEDTEALEWLGLVHALQGRYADAIEELRRAGSPAALRAWVFALAGQPDSARARLDEVEQRARSGHVPPRQLVLGNLAVGNRARALDYLEAAYRDRSRDMAWINVMPTLASLRAEPRFQVLLARMKFPR
jgi:DNA-binding SARP family transcriptional activator/TolB-like protein/Tfp pilus assembly protein PilF